VTRYVLDVGARRLDAGDGPVLLGGSPLIMLRLTGAGERLVDRVAAGDDLADLPAASPAAGLLDRLVHAGICHPVPDPAAGPNRGEVTVIVPVYDRPGGLAHTLAALAETATGVHEVVVVDDASADPGALARVVADAPAPVRLVRRDRNGGPGAARNTGAAGSATTVLAFVDAGCTPTPGWLDVLLPHLADARVALAAPRITALAPPPSPSTFGRRTSVANEMRPGFGEGSGAGARVRATAVERYEAARSSLDLGPDPAPVRPRSKVPYVPSTTFVVRADAFRAADGFDETLRVGEDVDLVWRLHEAGHRLRYDPAATVAHDHPTTLRRWAARRRDYGTSAAPLARRHPGNLAPLGISGWSAAVWGAAAAGHALLGAAMAAGTSTDLGRRFTSRRLAHPWREAATLAGRGHLGAGRLLASTLLRAWLPLTAVAVPTSRRARRAVAAAIVLPPLVEWWQRRPDLDPIRYVALAALDDAAYGLGVWQGVLADHTLEPVLPSFTNWKA
jgi:GT2 family glycosyltransferase